jgi:SAM-dependent methyltransferase
MSVLGKLHGGLVYDRRVRVLADRLAAAMPRAEGGSGPSVLDIGCGDGLIASLVRDRVPGLSVEGLDILLRPKTHIPVTIFDGRTIPHEDNSFDAVMFVDVLHHTDDPRILIREAARVARRAVIIKDHLNDGLLSESTLRLMDYVGNAHHGVRLPYNYWPRKAWESAWGEIGLTVDVWDRVADLYPPYASWVFGRGLHFIARLTKTEAHPRAEVVIPGARRAGAGAVG